MKIKHIRKFRTKEATESLVLWTVISQVTAILFCMVYQTEIQKISAKLVLGLSKYDSVTNALITLHWLSVCASIEFKIGGKWVI